MVSRGDRYLTVGVESVSDKMHVVLVYVRECHVSMPLCMQGRSYVFKEKRQDGKYDQMPWVKL